MVQGAVAEIEPPLPAAGQQPPPQAVREVCWRCHPVDGTGRGPGAFPSLAGQRAEYLYASLRAFADRSRHSGIMSGIAANLSSESMRAIASYYEGLPPRAATTVTDHSLTAPAYPRLAAQHVPYLASQLELLRSRHRGGSPNVALMHVFVDRLRPEQIRDVTRYYASLNP